ncbi:DNA polymerase III subunit alpha [Streptococcus cuniculipharyngis]|uniref:DNA polymerase III subunit alpha n=1 Tax=Streptococcus cuniculipharyngis TaxID=1562651 RepID=A0A5C5S9X7_9STRE|nr:DNA polymerase III subunit alpha [Streptococcus cuniculipharyngis]TWS96903.1 DNA polymerase III subunit alpha [Streptococcus cuniculipharyngis]
MFVQLDTKTVYSFMDSLIDVKDYVAMAKQLGYQQLGIMDRGNLYAAYHFIQAAKKEGLRPILGIELSLNWSGQDLRLYAIAQNTEGYHHLIKLATCQMTQGVSLADLEDYGAGVAFIVPYTEGVLEVDLPLDYYLGVFLDSPQVDYSRPIIPLQTVRYYQDEDTEVLQVLHAIRDNVSLAQAELAPRQQCFYPAQQVADLFEERFPGSIARLQQLVAGVDYQLDNGLKLPRFNRNKEAVVELAERAQAGLVAKGSWTAPYQSRLQEELAIIHQMGFDDYFLIVWDLLRFGRSKGYYMGMGRGSAAGSLVAYALDITGIDPVKNNLLFERFLNVERYSMPDIDIDLPDIYRGEFLRYVRDRYGRRHSAQIVTFSTFGAKQALRDVFKRFGASEYELSQLSRKIGFKDSLASAYQQNMSFRQLIASKQEYQKAFKVAQIIEGKPRQTSIHAAGIVMSDDDLTDHIPLKSGEEMMITQFDAESVESNGLLKMDFLGLRNLTFVQKMQETVASRYGVTIDIKAIDLEDAPTLALFAAGKTKGIFQFERAGAIHLLKRIKPSAFEEVVATTSLNRPGASDYTENFIRRKYGQEAIEQLDPLVDQILAPSYGIMLYQEQVMQIAQVYAGFSLGKADLLRRAMSKKDQKEMQAMASEFMAGAQSLGHPADMAQDIFERMAKFAGYGFNRSHAYAYSALAFQLAYFKCHYPDVFYDIMLNYSSSDYIEDALQAGFHLAKFSINQVSYHHRLDQQYLYLGLKMVKGLAQDLAKWLVEQSPFVSMEDFLTRLPNQYRKAEVLEPLIKVGLFDDLEANRKKLLLNLEPLFIFVTELGSLFGETSYNWLETSDYSNHEKYDMERELLGVGLSPHPLVAILQEHEGNFTPLDQLVADQSARLLGQIEAIREIRTKSQGELMAFLTVTDLQRCFDVTVFPGPYAQLKDQLAQGNILYFLGKTQERQGKLQLVLQTVQVPSQEKFWIQLKNHEHDQEISQLLSQYPGDIPVILHYEETKETVRSRRHLVAKSEELEGKLKTYVMKTIFH